jgi:hypothetical protein
MTGTIQVARGLGLSQTNDWESKGGGRWERRIAAGRNGCDKAATKKASNAEKDALGAASAPFFPWHWTGGLRCPALRRRIRESACLKARPSNGKIGALGLYEREADEIGYLSFFIP